MDSQQFLDWLEQKLRDVGVEKVVPEGQALAAAYRHQRHKVRVQQAIDAAVQDLPVDDEVPVELEEQVRALLRDDPSMAWDEALAELAAQADEAEAEAS
jgi:hypothetical protein